MIGFEVNRGRRGIRRGEVLSFSSATWKAWVTLDGSLSAVEMMVGAWVNAGALVAGAKVAVMLFDENNPADGVIVGAYGTAAHGLNRAGLYFEPGADLFPDGDGRGLVKRLINLTGGAVTSHFRDGAIPDGYTWAATSGVMYGTPTVLDYDLNNDYMGVAANGAGQRHFLHKAVANAAASWQNKVFDARVRAGGGAECGIRIDDGSSAASGRFLEFYSDGTAGNGTHTLKVRRQDTTGGGETVTVTAALKTIDAPFFLRVMCQAVAPSYRLICYIIAEDGQVSSLFATGALNWIPSAGRVGLFVKEAGFYSMVDLFYTTF